MKKLLMLSILFCLIACGSSKPSNSKKPSNFSSPIISNSVNNNSDSNGTKPNKTFEEKVYNKHARENLLSQEQISNVNIALTTKETLNKKMKNSASVSVSAPVEESSPVSISTPKEEKPSISIPVEDYSSISQPIYDSSNSSSKKEESVSSSSSLVVNHSLSGDLSFGEFDPEASSKMINEPCSMAFSTLQRLIFSGNGSYDFNNKTIGGIRINRFEEDSSLTLIRYGDYNSFIGASESDPYCFIICIFDDKSFAINYMALTGFVAYWANEASFLDEFNDLVAQFEMLNIATLPLNLYKSILEKEGSPNAWKDKFDLDISAYVAPNKYVWGLEELYYSRHRRIAGENDELIINDNELNGVIKLVTPYYLPVPEGIEKIHHLRDKTAYSEVSAVYIPASVKEIENKAFETLGVEFFFIDEYKENLSQDYISALESSNPNARIYYKDKWEKYCDIIMPKEYYYSMYENNIDGEYIKDKVTSLSKILQLGAIIPVKDYNALLDEYNEIVDKLTLDSAFLTDIDNTTYAFYDRVLSKINTDKKYYFYVIEDGIEVKVNDVTGEQFIKDNILFKFEIEFEIIEHISIEFNTKEWPSIQLSEAFGENVIPDFKKEGLTYTSFLDDSTTMIRFDEFKKEYFDEYIEILLANGYQLGDRMYWKRVNGDIVNIYLHDFGQISISYSDYRVVYPTTDVTITYKEVNMKGWPSEDIIKEKAPFYVEDLPKFYVENDSLFQVMFFMDSITCSCTYNETIEKDFINELTSKGYTLVYNEYDGTLMYYQKQYDGFSINVFLQVNDNNFHAVYIKM